MDIESHTMTHAHLPDLLSSPARLTYEIGCAKQCLSNHGFDTTIFGYPLNSGSDNPTIVNLVAKYYSFARSGSDPLMFLNCKDCHGMASTITVPLFAQEMQYLHDNGFKVLTLSQLGYDTTNNVFNIKNAPLPNATTTRSPTTAVNTTTVLN